MKIEADARVRTCPHPYLKQFPLQSCILLEFYIFWLDGVHALLSFFCAFLDLARKTFMHWRTSIKHYLCVGNLSNCSVCYTFSIKFSSLTAGCPPTPLPPAPSFPFPASERPLAEPLEDPPIVLKVTEREKKKKGQLIIVFFFHTFILKRCLPLYLPRNDGH